MTRLEKMQAVVNAAREWLMPSHSASVIHAREVALRQALAALDADAEAVETVTLAVWRSVTGQIALSNSGAWLTQEGDWTRLGTVTLPLERGA